MLICWKEKKNKSDCQLSGQVTRAHSAVATDDDLETILVNYDMIYTTWENEATKNSIQEREAFNKVELWKQEVINRLPHNTKCLCNMSNSKQRNAQSDAKKNESLRYYIVETYWPIWFWFYIQKKPTSSGFWCIFIQLQSEAITTIVII